MLVGAYELNDLAERHLLDRTAKIEEAYGVFVDLIVAEARILGADEFGGEFEGYLMVCFPVSKDGSDTVTACAVYPPCRFKEATTQ